MAKRSKKAGSPATSLVSALIMLIPAALAAATAFMNTIMARDNGAFDSLGLEGGTSKGRKKSRKNGRRAQA
jgi:hypothetical protein